MRERGSDACMHAWEVEGKYMHGYEALIAAKGKGQKWRRQGQEWTKLMGKIAR